MTEMYFNKFKPLYMVTGILLTIIFFCVYNGMNVLSSYGVESGGLFLAGLLSIIGAISSFILFMGDSQKYKAVGKIYKVKTNNPPSVPPPKPIEILEEVKNNGWKENMAKLKDMDLVRFSNT